MEDAIKVSVISPLEGEMSGRTEGGALPARQSQQGECWRLSPGTSLPLADTRHALPIALPFGSSDAATLIAFLRTAEAQGVGDIRLAPGRQMLLALRVSGERRDLARQSRHPRLHHQPRRPPRPHRRLPRRAGLRLRPTSPARDIALQVAPKRSRNQLSDTFTLHVSGCAKGCARQAIATLTLVGDEKGAGLVVGGTAKDRPLAYTQPDARSGRTCPRRRRSLARRWTRPTPAKLAGAFERA